MKLNCLKICIHRRLGASLPPAVTSLRIAPLFTFNSKVFLSACSSLEVRTSSWSGPSRRASAKSRRGWGGCVSRRSRTWSWPSLSARPKCPAPDRPRPLLLRPLPRPSPRPHPSPPAARTPSIRRPVISAPTLAQHRGPTVCHFRCERPVNFQTWLDACARTLILRTRLLTNKSS